MELARRTYLSIDDSWGARLTKTALGCLLAGMAGLQVVAATRLTRIASGETMAVAVFGGHAGSASAADSLVAIAPALSVAGAAATMGAVPILTLGFAVVLRAWRVAAWLEATTLVRRGAVLTRRIDLSVARISLSCGSRAELIAMAPRSAWPVRLPIRAGARLLPAGQLIALAEVLSAYRGPEPGSAMAVAARLRTLAADPFADE